MSDRTRRILWIQAFALAAAISGEAFAVDRTFSGRLRASNGEPFTYVRAVPASTVAGAAGGHVTAAVSSGGNFSLTVPAERRYILEVVSGGHMLGGDVVCGRVVGTVSY